MWKSSDGRTFRDQDQFVAANGTTYPGNYPKAEVPGLAWEADPPAPPPTVAEKQSRIDVDIVRLEAKQARAVRETILGQPGAQARLQKIEDDIAALRAQRAAL